MRVQQLAIPKLPKPTPHAKRSRTERVFRVEWESSEGRLSLADIEGTARAAYVKAGALDLLGIRPLRLLRESGCRFRPGHPCGTAGAQLCAGEIVVYRAELSDRELGTDVLHEFAHWLLRKQPHGHRDVWLLTLALAFPAAHLGIVRPEGWTLRTLLSHQRHVLPWVLRERAWMARVLAKNPANEAA